MSLSNEWPLRKISEPHPTNDVILEAGKSVNVDNNTALGNGNQRLWELIHSRKDEYDRKSRLEKPLVAVEVLKEWRKQDPPGRFLVVEVDSSPPLWKDVGEKRARNHISKLLKQAINDSAPENIHPDEHDNDTTLERNGETCPQHARRPLDWKNVANKLYEREEQAGKLRKAFERSRHADAAHHSELVLVCGLSGSGKTELARSLDDIVTAAGGFFLFGKFDQFRHQTDTYSAFFAAIQQFTTLLALKGPKTEEEVREAVYKSVGAEVHLLVEAMPFLGKLLKVKPKTEDPSRNDSRTADKSKNRFAVAFRRFIRAIISAEHPICLVLDDLQWSDGGSLNLLESLASPAFGNRRGLLLLATVRGNEVNVHDQLAVLLRELEAQGTCIMNIEVASLSVETLTQMIEDAGMPAKQSSTLGAIVFDQTRGNPFFSTQYLQNLEEEGLLKRESSEAEWEFHEDELQLSTRSEGQDGHRMVRLLAKKMKQLPPEVQEVLMVGACIGSEVKENLLFHACTVSSSSVLLALSVAEERGLIVYNFETGVGMFRHDAFQAAAFELIPEDQRGRFQLQIGRTLRAQLSEDEFSESVLLIASLMVQGTDLIDKEDEREKLARLCILAARKAAGKSAFSAALQYIEYGMKLLTLRRWRDQYELSILLYSTGCELAYCNGDHDTVDLWSKEALENVRCLNDKVHVITSVILSLDSRWQMKEAANLCFELLDQYGHRFPRKATKVNMYFDFLKTRRMLRGNHDILNLPPMTDPNALTAMSVIHLLYPIVLLADFGLSPFTAFRLVRLTLRHGISSMSSVGFAFYASVLVRLKKIEEGCFYGKLALRIMEKYPVKEFEARTIIACWGNVMTEIEPLRSCLEPYSFAHRTALRTGDFNSAMVSLFCQFMLRFFTGDSLRSIVDDIKLAKELSHDYNHKQIDVMIDPLLQACYNLMGRSVDPLILTGEAMDEEQWKAPFSEGGKTMMLLFLAVLKLYIAIYMNELDFARDNIMPDVRKNLDGIIVPYVFKITIFLQGMFEAHYAKRNFLHCWRAQRHLQYLEKASLQCPENNINKAYLVSAELSVARGDYDKSELRFDKAIHYAEKEGFLNEQALACEKAARMHASAGRSAETAKYFEQAIALYHRWGAEAKVMQLQQLVAREKLNRNVNAN